MREETREEEKTREEEMRGNRRRSEGTSEEEYKHKKLGECVERSARGLKAVEKVNIWLSSKAGGELQRERERGMPSRFTVES